MIQRIQSLWLFLAALISGALFIFPVYEYNSTGTVGAVSVTGTTTADTIAATTTTGAVALPQVLQATNFYPLLIVAAIMTVLPLIAIFMFSNRKKQRGMAIGSLFACIGFIGVMVMRIAHVRKMNAPTVDQYSIPGALLPVLAIIFLIMAIVNINKDEKLVRSMDRLR